MQFNDPPSLTFSIEAKWLFAGYILDRFQTDIRMY